MLSGSSVRGRLEAAGDLIRVGRVSADPDPKIRHRPARGQPQRALDDRLAQFSFIHAPLRTLRRRRLMPSAGTAYVDQRLLVGPL